MTDLTAIDILVEPDAGALARAAAENARLRAEYPRGFVLDESHQPHITLLQRYVRSGEMEAVFTAVEHVIGSHDRARISFRATAIRHMTVASAPGLGLAAIVVTPAPEVLALQNALIEAVKPFAETGGTAAAFQTTVDAPSINADTLVYVERYVPDHSGPNFVTHLTIGLAPLARLEMIEAEAFEEFTVSPDGFAVFRLGDNGTARLRLKTWPAK